MIFKYEQVVAKQEWQQMKNVQYCEWVERIIIIIIINEND